ncbi:MAG: radical SAM protein [Arenicellales bacterium]|jgi:uncharacterized Fe-S cluster-containing radical SAM superfamily protein|nr:radical SAM protein [Arenicellales bacterium]
MMTPADEHGYDPVALAAATEKVVVAGNRRKYASLARPLRFYGGTSSATEVGCNLRCKFCFSDKPVRKPGTTGKFFTPRQVFDALDASAKKHGHKLISASASEGTLGRQHLFELLELVDQSPYVFVLETNGMTLGDDPEFVPQLARFKNLHVRVSIKGTNPDEYSRLTGAIPSSYALPYRALKNLINAGVSCNACLSLSFSTGAGLAEAKLRLAEIHPGLLISLEEEYITLFPKVAKRLREEGIKPTAVRHRGRIVRLDTPPLSSEKPS